MNLTIAGTITLKASLAHGAFRSGGLVIPFRREPLLQRTGDGQVVLDDYALTSSDPAQRETLRQYAQRVLRIIWQSKREGVKWTYAQLSERIGVTVAMTETFPAFVEQMLDRFGATHPSFYQDDAKFLIGTLAAVDATLILNLLREPGERLLIVARMQAESAARYEKRDLPQRNGQLSLFSAEGEAAAESPAFKVTRVPYIPMVPVYSGNALRNGVIRRNGARFILDHFGWGVPMHSLRSLFVGGALQRTGTKGIDIGARREMLALMPLYGLLGGAFNTNALLEGSAKTMKVWPLVREARPVLPRSCHEEAGRLGMRDIIDVEASSRREDSTLLTGRYLNEAVILGEKDDAKGQRKHSGMFFEREVLKGGTRLHSAWHMLQTTPHQMGAWVSGWAAWAKRPFLGGVTQHGHGLADIEYYDTQGEPLLEVIDGALWLSDQAQTFLDGYVAHLEANEDAITDLLQATDRLADSTPTPILQDELEAAEVD